MRKTFITLLTILGIAAAHAEDYPYMMFQTNDGTILTMASASLTITFSEGNMMLSNGAESKTIALADLKKMCFASDPAGIESTPENEMDKPVDVFIITGIFVGKYEKLEKARSSLERGIYVVKSKNQNNPDEHRSSGLLFYKANGCWGINQKASCCFPTAAPRHLSHSSSA